MFNLAGHLLLHDLPKSDHYKQDLLYMYFCIADNSLYMTCFCDPSRYMHVHIILYAPLIYRLVQTIATFDLYLHVALMSLSHTQDCV